MFPIRLFSESSEKNITKPQTHNTDLLWKKNTFIQKHVKNKLQLTTVTNSKAFWKWSNIVFSAPRIYIYKTSGWITNSKTEGVSFRPNVCKNKQHYYNSLAQLDFNLEYTYKNYYFAAVLDFLNLLPAIWWVPLEVSRLFSKHTGVPQWGGLQLRLYLYCPTHVHISLNLRQHHINLQI